MSEIKVGDRVKHRVGDTGTVVARPSLQNTLCVDNDSGQRSEMWFKENITLLEPASPKKEYKPTGKPISLKALWEAQKDHDYHEFLVEWVGFMGMILRLTYPIRWVQDWGLGLGGTNVVALFLETAEPFENRTQAMLDFAVRHGFLEEVKPAFETIPVSFDITSDDDLERLAVHLDYLPRKIANSIEAQLKKAYKP